MKIALAILLNLALLAWLLPWLRREWQAVSHIWRLALVLGLSGRLLVASYTATHLIHDGVFMSLCGRLWVFLVWTNPQLAWQALIGNRMHVDGGDLVYFGMSNTFFFVKILGFLNLASLGSSLVDGWYLALFSFVACWKLARTLARTFPATPAGAGLLAFVVWPSVMFWATGISKEPVFLGTGAWLLALFVELVYGPEKRSVRASLPAVLGVLVLGIVHFKMRYFCALPLLGALSWLLLMRAMQQLRLMRSRWAQVLMLVGLLAGGLWLASEISVAFRINKFTSQVAKVYGDQIRASAGRPHFEYPNLRPTTESIMQHLPLAVVNTFTRPWLGESGEWRYLISGLENAVLLLLLALALVALWRGRAGQLPFMLVIALIVHCLIVAALLGLTTPNLGTLGRYRSGVTPYLVLLLLQNDYAAAFLTKLGLNQPTKLPATAPQPAA